LFLFIVSVAVSAQAVWLCACAKMLPRQPPYPPPVHLLQAASKEQLTEVKAAERLAVQATELAARASTTAAAAWQSAAEAAHETTERMRVLVRVAIGEGCLDVIDHCRRALVATEAYEGDLMEAWMLAGFDADEATLRAHTVASGVHHDVAASSSQAGASS
jgi:hypothetical protein